MFVEEARGAGEPFGADIIPFGALVEYIPPPTRKDDHTGKWGSSSVPGIFAGYELGESGRWTKNYLVWNLKDFDFESLRPTREQLLAVKPENATEKD